MHPYVHTYTTAFAWSHDSFQESLFSFYGVVPGDWTQVTTHGNKQLDHLSHLTSLPILLMHPMLQCPNRNESTQSHCILNFVWAFFSAQCTRRSSMLDKWKDIPFLVWFNYFIHHTFFIHSFDD